MAEGELTGISTAPSMAMMAMGQRRPGGTRKTPSRQAPTDAYSQQAAQRRSQANLFSSIPSEDPSDYNTLVQNAGYDAFEILAYNPEYQFLNQFAKSTGHLTSAYAGIEVAQVQANQAINLMEYIDFMEGWETSPEGEAWMADPANANQVPPALIEKAEELGLRLGEGREGAAAFVDAAWNFSRSDAYRMMDQAQRKLALKEFMIQMLQKYYDESMKSVSSESAIRLASSS